MRTVCSVLCITNSCILRLVKPNTTSRLTQFFSENGEFIGLPKGALLVKSDGQLFLLVSGSVGLFSYSKNGKESLINIFRAPSMFPLSLVFTKSDSRYLYEAVTDIKVYRVQVKLAEKFLREDREVLFDLLTRIYKGLEGYYRRMEALLSGDARQKLATHLLTHALRFGERRKDGLQVDVSQNFLGIQTGLSRETVARELGKLKKEGIVRYSGRKLVITNVNSLEKASGI